MSTPPPPPADPQEIRVVWGCVVGISLGLGALGLLILVLLNQRKTVTIEQEVVYTGWKKWTIFFFKDLLLELIGLGFCIFTIVQLEQDKWSPVNMTKVKTSFYVFSVLKYVMVVFLILQEELISVKNFVISVANTGWVPPNWPELLEALIFIPCLILDGVFLNCDYIITKDSGDLFPFDGIFLLGLDVLLYLKYGILDTLEAYQHNYHYKVLSIFYSMSEFVYTILMCIIFVLLQLQYMKTINPPTASILELNSNMIIVLVVAIIHPFVARFTSMCLQGIKALNSSKRLRAAPKARVAALNLYVRWFWFHPIMLVINAAVYALCFVAYYLVFQVTYNVFNNNNNNLRQEAFIQGCIVGVFILANIFTVFYMINWAYALLKRLGVFLARCCGVGCGFPFDCSTYAKAMNRGLAELNASFRMNTHMTCD